MTTAYQHFLMGTYQDLDVWVTGVHSVDPTNSVVGAHSVWLNAVAELWRPGSAGNAGWASVCPTGVVATKAVTYTLLPLSTRKSGKTETSLSLAGTAFGDAIPPTVAALALLDSLGNLGRHSGRMYLPAPSTQNWNNGRLAAGAITTLGTCVTKALKAMYAGGLHPCMLQANTLQANEITDIRASNKTAALRSRDNGPVIYAASHIFP